MIILNSYQNSQTVEAQVTLRSIYFPARMPRRTPPCRGSVGAAGVDKNEKSAQNWLLVAMNRSHHCGGVLGIFILAKSIIAHIVPMSTMLAAKN